MKEGFVVCITVVLCCITGLKTQAQAKSVYFELGGAGLALEQATESFSDPRDLLCRFMDEFEAEVSNACLPAVVLSQ